MKQSWEVLSPTQISTWVVSVMCLSVKYINTTSYASSDKKQDVGVWKDYDTIHRLEHKAVIISPNKLTMQLSVAMDSGCGLMCHAFWCHTSQDNVTGCTTPFQEEHSIGGRSTFQIMHHHASSCIIIIIISICLGKLHSLLFQQQKIPVKTNLTSWWILKWILKILLESKRRTALLWDTLFNLFRMLEMNRRPLQL